jgi:hypothetical protein
MNTFNNFFYYSENTTTKCVLLDSARVEEVLAERVCKDSLLK